MPTAFVRIRFCGGTEARQDGVHEAAAIQYGRVWKSAADSIELLEEPDAEKLDPESILVDINQGRYFAATVRYPKEIAFHNVRRNLNDVYGKWESPTFANDPEMGIWRNEDDAFSTLSSFTSSSR